MEIRLLIERYWTLISKEIAMQEAEGQNESDKNLGAQAGGERWYKSVVRRLLSHWFPEKHLKRREYIISALGYITIGITVIFAPQYIQTNDHNVIGISRIASLLLLIMGICRLRRIYRHILLWLLYTYLFCAPLFLTALLYWMSQMIPRARQTDRTISFMFLIFTIFEFFVLISYLPDLYEKNKENIKIHFNLKNISVVTLGILTMGTALFQFLQVLLPFIPH